MSRRLACLVLRARRFLLALRLHYYHHALREIDLLHPDLPAIVRHIRDLEAERDALRS